VLGFTASGSNKNTATPFDPRNGRIGRDHFLGAANIDIHFGLLKNLFNAVWHFISSQILGLVKRRRWFKIQHSLTIAPGPTIGDSEMAKLYFGHNCLKLEHIFGASLYFSLLFSDDALISQGRW
jgi:hypothetical protein